MIDIVDEEKVYSIKDSGDRRDFGTGAVRDMAAGKGRFDLMPLNNISDWLEDNIFYLAGKIFDTGDVDEKVSMAYEMLDEFCNQLHYDKYSLLLAVAKHYENGAVKYGERNWEKGIPTKSFIDSALRHYAKVKAGRTDEDHVSAFVFNVLGYAWTIEHKPELDDFR